MTKKWEVIVYGEVDRVICDTEEEADSEIDRQDRLCDNLTRVREIETEDEDEIVEIEAEDDKLNLQSKERTWEMWTLSEEDITHLAKEKGLSLEGKDIDEVARQVKKGIENALGEWPYDIIIEEAIRATEPTEH